MEMYNGRYFVLNKGFLTMMGLWPYNDWKRYIIRSIFTAMTLIFSTPHVIGIILDIKDTDKLLDHLTAVLFLTAMFFKLLIISVSDIKMRIMWDAIVENWALIAVPEEVKIMIETGERGRKLTIAYAGMIFGSGSFFIMLPLLPTLLDKVKPLPTPRDTLSILNGEFLVENKEAYYWLFYLSDALSVLLVTLIVVVIDTAYRLQQPNRLAYDDSRGMDEAYTYMSKIIQLHQRVLDFSIILGDSYSMCFFVLMLFHVVQLPTVSVLILINLHQPVHLFRYVFVFLALTVHQLALHWAAQRLSDASENIFTDSYCNEWYSSSLRTRKLLSFLMFRCVKPAVISAGGIIDMGMATFYGVTSKAISYITVLGSFR
ncbi:odorant receptor 49b-like isoform X2 [Phymastichus coffea]|uniref:odorant receptor 49b-like isoform X2 n=1 Tax=Phymastichus coffea TaxID=108790 RepID=UPI00273A8561|nr:odorant receptor 49b-like isoform X2 [Phymastichus coffea]